MPTIQAHITKTDGTVNTISAISSQETFEFEKADIARINVSRADANSISLDENLDEVQLEIDGQDTFGGILRDINRGGGVVELVVETYERRARDAEHTQGGERWESEQDSAIIQDAIDQVPDLSAGTLENIEAGLDFVFSYTSPAKKMRTVADATLGVLQYQPDATVDYTHLDNVGTVRTEVISPANQNIVDNFIPKRQGGDKRVTHLTMLGAGEGDGQKSATIISDTWQSGDPQAWKTRTNKDITDDSVLQSTGEVLMDELNTEFIEVEAVIEGIDVQLGDTFDVQHNEEQIDHQMRVAEHTRSTSSSGQTHQVVLSTRLKARETEYEKEVKDSERYNMAFEGSAVTLNTGGGRQPVNADHNYQFDVYYPAEVEYEHRVQLHVRGRPYRAFSQGAASGGGEHSHTIEFDVAGHSHSVDVTDHIHTVPLDTTSANNAADSDNAEPGGVTRPNTGPGDTVSFEFDLPTVDGSGSAAYIYLTVQNWEDEGNFLRGDFSITNSTKSRQLYATDSPWTYEEKDMSLHQVVDTRQSTSESLSGDTIRIEYTGDTETAGDTGTISLHAGAMLMGTHNHNVEDSLTSEGNGGFAQTTTSGGGYLEEQTTTNDVGEHTHPPDPGIVEVFNGQTYYPQDCQVLVNGTEVGGTFGTGTGFQEDVDLSGQLNPGQWNSIEISSSSLGHIQAHLDIDVYRQILGGG